MPKERVRKADRDGWADLLVQWGKDELGEHGEGRVRLFVIAAELGMPGGFEFHPDLERVGEGVAESWKDVTSVGPVDIMLDRDGCNRMIQLLRRARDKTFGRDE